MPLKLLCRRLKSRCTKLEREWSEWQHYDQEIKSSWQKAQINYNKRVFQNIALHGPEPTVINCKRERLELGVRIKNVYNGFSRHS